MFFSTRTIRWATAAFMISTICCQAAEPPSNHAKDRCLLDINLCPGKNYYPIVEKIRRLRHALKLGTQVYTPEEVTHLEYILKESYYCVERIEAESFIEEE